MFNIIVIPPEDSSPNACSRYSVSVAENIPECNAAVSKGSLDLGCHYV